MRNFYKRNKLCAFVLATVFALYSCRSKVTYHDGLNILPDRKGSYEEIYIYQGIRNGAYVVSSDTSSMISDTYHTIDKCGTYSQNMRNGLWDTIYENKPAQIYYADDSGIIRVC
jgi:hypothetical protein